MPADRAFELTRVGPQPPANDGEVRAAHRAVGKLRGQRAMCNVVAGCDDQARRALVEPVDDAWARLSTSGRPFATEAEQRVNEGARAVARRRVNHHPCRLVDDHEVGVLVDDLQRDRLRE